MSRLNPRFRARLSRGFSTMQLVGRRVIYADGSTIRRVKVDVAGARAYLADASGRNVNVTVEAADGRRLVFPLPLRKQAQGQRFIEKVNTASAHFASREAAV